MRKVSLVTEVLSHLVLDIPAHSAYARLPTTGPYQSRYETRAPGPHLDLGQQVPK